MAGASMLTSARKGTEKCRFISQTPATRHTTRTPVLDFDWPIVLRPLRSKASNSSWRWAVVKRSRPSLALRMREESVRAGSDDIDDIDDIDAYATMYAPYAQRG